MGERSENGSGREGNRTIHGGEREREVRMGVAEEGDRER